MEGEAANVSVDAEDAVINGITAGLRNTIAAEVRKALQSSKKGILGASSGSMFQ